MVWMIFDIGNLNFVRVLEFCDENSKIIIGKLK